MNQTTTGWVLFIAAIGVMSTLIAGDLKGLQTWSQATTPAFLSLMLAHLGTVITAFIAGKLIPTDRDPSDRTRSTDS
jgi:hypothetical protein